MGARRFDDREPAPADMSASLFATLGEDRNKEARMVTMSSLP